MTVFFPCEGVYGSWPLLVKPTIRQGSSGDAVKYLRGVLRNTSGATCPCNGSFGSTTKVSVKLFQQFWGLTVDGVVGGQTWPVIDWAARGFPT